MVATQGGVGPSLNLSQQGGGHGQLVSLSLVRCHELADDVLLAALASLPSLSKLTLSTCRAVTCGGWRPAAGHGLGSITYTVLWYGRECGMHVLHIQGTDFSQPWGMH